MMSTRAPAAIGLPVLPWAVPSATEVEPDASVPVFAGAEYVFTTPVSVPPAPSRPGVAQAIGCTTVYAVAELLFALGSPVREAVAVLLSVVALAGVVALIVIVAVVPIAIGEVMEQLTVAVPWHAQSEEATTET